MTRSPARVAVRTVTVAAAATAVALAVPGTALAHDARIKPVKPFYNSLIVVQKSIGGIALGAKPAVGAKGFPKKDCTPGGCSYAGAGYQVGLSLDTPRAGAKKVVTGISLSLTTGKDAAARVRTSSGVGLGSSFAAAKKLPHARSAGTKTSGYVYFGTGKIGSVNTTFFVANDRVTQIYVQLLTHVG